MGIRNRELSQFGSFIYIDDSSKDIGITISDTPYVGIGTDNPTSKLTVIGDTNISGVITAAQFFGDGSSLTGVAAIIVDGWIFNNAGVHTLAKVGIGTTNPTSQLTVRGDATISGVTTIGGRLSIGGSTTVNGSISASGILTASNFISTVTTGTQPIQVNSQTLVTNLNADYLRGKIPPSGDIVGTSDSQTLLNKTINLTSNTLTATTVQFNNALTDDDFATLNGNQTLLNKTLTLPVISSISNSGTITIPTGTGTLVSTNSVGVVTTGMIANGAIIDVDIASNASIAITKLAASTISGISLGGSLTNLTAGTFINFNTGTTYNGSAARTISVAATTANDPNTIIARGSSGDFSAGSISCGNLSATFVVTAADFNSTSDQNLKTNIKTVESPLQTVEQLRGVTFDWKNSNKPSIGVIAQELEQVLPELVTNTDPKTVNYNGLIGVLIEAVKELSDEVKQLKEKIQ